MSKVIGELSEMMFQVEATKRSLIVSKPFGDNQKYDFVVDGGTRLFRVQVKSTSTKKENSKNTYRYSVSIKCGRDHCSEYNKSNCDIIALHVQELDLWYFIPVELISGHAIRVYPHKKESCGTFELFKEHWGVFENENAL